MPEKNFQRYLITAALPYANGPLHIGHLAGVYIPADIYARYLRSQNHDILFVCGTDEHGVPITIKAQQEGVSPQDIVDKYHHQIKKSFDILGMSFDIFSRTSHETHYETARNFFLNLYHKNVFEAQTSEQYYDEENEQFLADRYIEGTCPKCGFEKAYGDQCENCGTSLSPNELINPVSKLSGNKPVLKETKHWYLPLNKNQNWLRQWILEEHKDWKPNVYGQCKSWLDQGLNPRAVTRDLSWGVPVPLEEARDKVMYVWFDAPIGYISATQELTPSWERYWKNEETKLVHFIGKDNIVFHCIIFPTMLKLHGEYILPDQVPANEFMNLEGAKISTSRNWAVWLHEYLEDLPGKEDVLRYVLTANAPETKDNDFSWKDFQARNNNELVAILGNFINRTLVLTHKYFDGKVPPANMQENDIHTEILQKIEDYKASIEHHIENYRFREALGSFMELARTGNKYLADTEPWKLIKDDEALVKTILNVCLQLSANIAIMMEPFMPYAAEKIFNMLNTSRLKWTEAGRTDIMPDKHPINKATLLFEKIDDKTIDKQYDKLYKNRVEKEEESQEPVNAKSNIAFDIFNQMDVRVGIITAAEKIPKADKLLKLSVNTGIDQRTVVSGIAPYYNPDEIIGQQVCMVINLEPKKIKGVESKGMILMAEDEKGNLHFVKPASNIKAGSVIK